MFNKLRNRIPLWKRLQWFIQRGKRGYADCDLWSLDSYLCKMLPKALRQLAKNSNGCPVSLYNKEVKGDECRKWIKILNAMADGFKAGADLIELGEYNEEKRKKLEDKHNAAMCLFEKYFFNLWD